MRMDVETKTNRFCAKTSDLSSDHSDHLERTLHLPVPLNGPDNSFNQYRMVEISKMKFRPMDLLHLLTLSISPLQTKSMLNPAAILSEHDITVTAQRIAVLRAVGEHPHATADGIAATVRQALGTISRQAVYDTLTLLTAHGILRRIEPAGSPALYESRVGDNHHHLVCRSCGITKDIDCAVGRAPCLMPAESHGFQIDEAEVIYWGTCPKCAEHRGHSEQTNTI
jgi:Fur family ferric uptake transcriptional regulator